MTRMTADDFEEGLIGGLFLTVELGGRDRHGQIES
jgi:hypothetical protein